MNNDTLNPKQIKAWRNVIYMHLEKMQPGAGIFAHVMPESEVIAYWGKMKTIIETPSQPMGKEIQTPKSTKCTHANSITGSNGKYCIDCEKYV